MKEPSEQKQEFNVRAKVSMRDFLRSKSWVEKVESIERMNVAGRLAKEAMKKAQGHQAGQPQSPEIAYQVGK